MASASPDHLLHSHEPPPRITTRRRAFAGFPPPRCPCRDPSALGGRTEISGWGTGQGAPAGAPFGLLGLLLREVLDRLLGEFQVFELRASGFGSFLSEDSELGGRRASHASV